MRVKWLLLVMGLAVLLTGCSQLSIKSISEIQCEDLIPEIISLSESSDNQTAPTILKVYDSQEVGRSTKRLDCEGDARLSSGDWRISFHLEEDRDGDRFVGYQVQLFN